MVVEMYKKRSCIRRKYMPFSTSHYHLFIFDFLNSLSLKICSTLRKMSIHGQSLSFLQNDCRKSGFCHQRCFNDWQKNKGKYQGSQRKGGNEKRAKKKKRDSFLIPLPKDLVCMLSAAGVFFHQKAP